MWGCLFFSEGDPSPEEALLHRLHVVCFFFFFFFFAVIDAENGAQPSCVTLALFFDVLLLQQK